MENDTESEKLDLIIFGQKFCSKLEHIPIKKRILLRDSAMYQHTPPLVEELNQQIDSSAVSQISNLPGSSFAGNHSDPNYFLKQQAANMKSLQFNDNSRDTVAMNVEDADSHPLFSGIQTPVDVIVDIADKDPRADAVSPCTEGELSSVSSFAHVAKEDVIIAKCAGAALSLTGDVTADFYSGENSSLKPDNVSCKDLEAVQLTTQENRILWDLNVEMDAWEKPEDPLNDKSKSDPITSDVRSFSNLERSEDYRLKLETAMSENDTENNGHPMFESMNSNGIYKQVQKTSDSANGEQCGSVSVDQQVPAGSCHVKACSISEPSMEISSMTQSCNHELSSKTDEHMTLRLGESKSNFFDSAPRRDPGSVCATPNNSVVSTEEQNCDNKNIIIEGEGSVNILNISVSEDNDLSKKGIDSKTGQHDVTLKSSADQPEQGVSVKECDLFATPEEKIIAQTITVAPSTRELTETPPKCVDIDTGNPLRGSFWKGCDVSTVQPVSASAMCRQDAIVVKQVPSRDKDCWTQIEQDYEDGELIEMDMHCWNEDETEIGEIECLDYEPEIDDIDDLDESQSSVSVCKGESGLQSKKCKLAEAMVEDHLVRVDDVKMGLNASGYGPRITQLEKKLSGWDQLPKDGRSSSSEKVQETQGMLSRTLRSELRSRSDIHIPTLSEDAEDKETVVERRIRHKDTDDSYPHGSGLDKFNGKRRSTPHIHGRNRADDWDSEHRCSVNYHDIYDNHSESRRMNINSKGHEQCWSRSLYDRNEAYGPHISYSRYQMRNGSCAEGSGRSLRGARNEYRGSLADDRSESEFCVRPQFARRERSFSPRPASHFSGTFIRSRSRSRTRSPPLWVQPYERLGPRVHRRSPEFSGDDRVKRRRLPFWKSNHPPDSETRYNSPPRSEYIRQNKSRWNDDEVIDLRLTRDRSPARSFDHKDKFDASCSRGSFKSGEDFRPSGYRGRMRELTPGRIRGYVGGKDGRNHEDSFEAGQRKRY